MRSLLLLAIAALAICPETMAAGDDSALRAVAESTDAFGKNFLKAVIEPPPSNLICSPLSAQMVLAMAAYGAGGATATQMRSTLFIPSNDELGQRGYQSLIQSLNSVTGVVLSLANKIYTANNFVLKPAYTELTTRKFLSTAQELDFSNAVAAANTINSWCEQQTHNRIKDIIKPDSITSDTKLILVNAVYFKGQWANKFQPTATQDRLFNIDTRTTKNVPTMYIKHSFRYGLLPEVDARFVEIPYEGKQLSMIIVLPNAIDGLKRVTDNMDKINMNQSLRRSYPTDVELYLPKFKIESTMELKPILEKMGMTEMFTNAANFSGIADTPLKVSKVVQKAFIEVNEEGSEAAAVTVMGMVARSGISPFQRPTVVFSADRPYLFMIYHRLDEISLFNGIVSQPK